MYSSNFNDYPFNTTEVYTRVCPVDSSINPSYTNSPSTFNPNNPIEGSDFSSYTNDNDDRFIGPGLIAPFLLGGIAGAAIARPGWCCGPWVRPVWPVPTPFPVAVPTPVPTPVFTSFSTPLSQPVSQTFNFSPNTY